MDIETRALRVTNRSPIMGRMEELFRAAADTTRAGQLDEWFREDGQALSALEARLPMARLGTMKSMQLLEQAGSVLKRRCGREKLQFLNPRPIPLIHDCQVSKYAKACACVLIGLGQALGNKGVRRCSSSSARPRQGASGRRLRATTCWLQTSESLTSPGSLRYARVLPGQDSRPGCGSTSRLAQGFAR